MLYAIRTFRNYSWTTQRFLYLVAATELVLTLIASTFFIHSGAWVYIQAMTFATACALVILFGGMWIGPLQTAFLHLHLLKKEEKERQGYELSGEFLSQFPSGPLLNNLTQAYVHMWPPSTQVPEFNTTLYDLEHDLLNFEVHFAHRSAARAQTKPVDLSKQLVIAQETFRSIYFLIKDEQTRLSPPSSQEPLATIPFVEVANIKKLVQIVRASFFTPEINEEKMFPELRMGLNVNRYNLSRKKLKKMEFEDNERIEPTDFDGTNQETIDAFLKETPLAKLFEFNIPYRMKTETRFSGMYIIAPQRHGKTQTLERMIFNDIKAGHGLVVIDPHRTMFDRLSKLKVLKDRLIIFDPADSPALSLFDAKLDTATDQEAAIRGVREAASYFLSGLLGTEMTGRQDVLYGYLAELMAHIPNATPMKLLDILSKDYDIEPHLNDLSPAAKRFFEKDFYDPKQYSTTRDELKWRLQKLVQDAAFSRIFGATKNMFDVQDVMDNGKVLLVHTVGLAKDHATIVGQYFIGQTYRAAMGRLQTGVRKPAFLYVDEAAPFFKDETISLFLREVRKVSVGGIFVNQKIADITNEKVKAAFTTCAIMLAAKTECADFMAKPMHTSADFIGSMRPGEWALYDDDQYQKAIKVDIPFGTLDEEPTLSDQEYEAMRQANRDRLKAPPPPKEDPPDNVINMGAGKK